MLPLHSIFSLSVCIVECEGKNSPKSVNDLLSTFRIQVHDLVIGVAIRFVTTLFKLFSKISKNVVSPQYVALSS
jgi:hypothetical protein